jgi:hypothetical protein
VCAQAMEARRCFSVEYAQPGTLGLLFSPDTTASLFTVEALAETSGLARSCPQIQPGCVLVAVQDVPLSGYSYSEGLAAIRSAGRPIRLTFEPAPADALAAAAASSPSSGLPPAAALETAHDRAARGAFGPSLAESVGSVIPLLGVGGAALEPRPDNLKVPGGPLLFRERRPLKKRRYRNKQRPSDVWKPHGGTSVTRLRLSPFSSSRELVRRVGKVIRPEGLPVLRFHQYEIGTCGVSAAKAEDMTVLYHVLPSSAAGVEAEAEIEVEAGLGGAAADSVDWATLDASDEPDWSGTSSAGDWDDDDDAPWMLDQPDSQGEDDGDGDGDGEGVGQGQAAASLDSSQLAKKKRGADAGAGAVRRKQQRTEQMESAPGEATSPAAAAAAAAAATADDSARGEDDSAADSRWWPSSQMVEALSLPGSCAVLGGAWFALSDPDGSGRELKEEEDEVRACNEIEKARVEPLRHVHQLSV